MKKSLNIVIATINVVKGIVMGTRKPMPITVPVIEDGSESIAIKREIFAPLIGTEHYMLRIKGAYRDHIITSRTYEVCNQINDAAKGNLDNSGSDIVLCVKALNDDLERRARIINEDSSELMMMNYVIDEFDKTSSLITSYFMQYPEEFFRDIAKVIPEVLFGYDAFLEHNDLERFIQENVSYYMRQVDEVNDILASS